MRQSELKSDVNTWQLKDFEILETLGTGSYGRVRLCKHKETQQYFAIKILKKQTIIKLKQVEHIWNERNLLMMSNSPFTVNLYKCFQDDQKLYMIQEYIPGGELFTHIRKAGKFPNDVAKFYTAEIICAIEFLHSKNIVFRDLKPENVLLDVKGHIKLTDFGFSKIVLDKTWTLCGTTEYLAPEVILGTGHNKAVDWWSLGILIYEMLVGYPPFFDDTPLKTYEKILQSKIEFPKFIDPNAKDLIQNLLKRDRTKRLGCLKDGVLDIKNHKWFKGVDWKIVASKGIQTPIPVMIKSNGDSRYYEKYPDSFGYTSGSIATEQQLLFKGFESKEEMQIE